MYSGIGSGTDIVRWTRWSGGTVTLLESEDYALLIFHGDAVTFIIVSDNEWNGRRTCQHVCNGRVNCTDEAKTKDAEPSMRFC